MLSRWFLIWPNVAFLRGPGKLPTADCLDDAKNVTGCCVATGSPCPRPMSGQCWDEVTNQRPGCEDCLAPPSSVSFPVTGPAIAAASPLAYLFCLDTFYAMTTPKLVYSIFLNLTQIICQSFVSRYKLSKITVTTTTDTHTIWTINIQ